MTRFRPVPEATRRALLKTFGATAATTFLLPSSVGSALAQAAFSNDPFSLGVASGDPLPDGFVLWTRLAPEPLAFGYGMPKRPVEVDWEVATDERLRNIVQSGTEVARPELGHAIHAEVGGLEPGRDYYYRFTVGAERSMVGRARTAPALGAKVERVRLGMVGCQNYEDGYYTAFRHLAEERPDFVFHYGDYIYENRVRTHDTSRYYGGLAQPTARRHLGDEPYSLDEYRRRYAQYTLDLDLQLARAACPWMVTWDDHEVDNNWTGTVDGAGIAPPEYFLLRRAAAAQAYFEHMPLRRASWPKGPDMQIYRRLAFGNLIDLHLLDTRQFRTDQPCGDGFKPACEGQDSDDAEMMGEDQERWLFEGLDRGRARWNLIGQQVMMMTMNREPWHGPIYNMDSWEGYHQPRQRLLRHIADRRLNNVVVLTGDEHQNFVGDLKTDYHSDKAGVVATEFVGTSISSGGDGADKRPRYDEVMRGNPHIRFMNDQRGYLMCDIGHDKLTANFRVMDRVTTPGGAISTRASFVVEPGKPGAKQA
ncbi:Alkaline phosphatase D [Nitrospirillum viridazoti Y2]|uniref:Alkaline phosphatase D n=1 Tax=Nitrospirillum amazonense TaxID=28077 RepID=A0A560IYW7_9PROT|nr:alkaline phosphatase D family protein [Nitrospirillum amazonense]EGY01290.1 Alkaline phosphatase D [Nitrospirillum amazonense Y2]TWB64213.1 alkaline phosphatase D [Nitrospirillum amazonense]